MKKLPIVVASLIALLSSTYYAAAQTKAIGPKPDDPRGVSAQGGGHGEKVSIGPKPDDPRALKPNPNDRKKGVTPNSKD